MYRIILILSIILFAAPLLADEAADKAEFKKLYAEFNDLYANSEEIDPIIEVGEKLYVLAPKAYGENAKNTAVVTFNLASLYDELGKVNNNEHERKAVELYEEYFKILDKNDTQRDVAYLDHYIIYATAKINVESIKSKGNPIRKIVSIADSIDLAPLKRGHVEFGIGILYFKAGLQSSSYKHLQKAIELYTTEKGNDYIAIGQVLFWQAKIDMAKKKRSKAEANFLRTLDIFEKNGQSGNETVLATHAFLVNLYEDMDQSEKSTKHCVAIGMERKKEFDIFELPIYRKPPEYPSSAARAGREAKVLLEFTVDKEGITRDVRILESSNKTFDKNSIDAIEKFRFAPQVKNGELVETRGVKNLLVYQMAK